MAANAPLLRYLLGLEGLALLRGWLELDEQTAGRRVEEIEDLLARRDELERDTAPNELSVLEGYAAWAPSYDGEANPLIAVEGPVVRELLRDLAPGRALDAACGTGRQLRLLTELGHETVGVDASAEMLSRARAAQPAADVREGDLLALPFEGGDFDVAVCALALGHLRELDAAIRELARVLRRGGRLIVSVIHPQLVALGGAALFTRAGGEPAFIREAPHLHGDYLAAFAAAGLGVSRCVEPVWVPETAAMVGKAAARIPQALEAALVGLPCVLIWDLERE